MHEWKSSIRMKCVKNDRCRNCLSSMRKRKKDREGICFSWCQKKSNRPMDPESCNITNLFLYKTAQKRTNGVLILMVLPNIPNVDSV